MQTTCNNCHSVFNITQPQLDAADGQVVCSVCLTEFNAFDSLEKKESLVFKAFSDETTEPQTPKIKSNFFSYLVILLLLSITPLQFVLYEKQNLLKNSVFRQIAITSCSIFPCSIADFRDSKQIELISRKVHSHPLEKKALIITATVMNNANQSQPFPKILISMANIQGKTQAQRLFEPAEYLPDNIFADQEMAPNIPLNINLEIVDPGQDLVAFEIDFL